MSTRYRLWCKVTELGPDQFHAVVIAVPSNGVAAGTHASDSALFSTRALAETGCRSIANLLRIRLEEQGYAVDETLEV
jgi:hypothetical protein